MALDLTKRISQLIAGNYENDKKGDDLFFPASLGREETFRYPIDAPQKAAEATAKKWVEEEESRATSAEQELNKKINDINNVSLTATTNDDMDTSTNARANFTIAGLFQHIWNKIRSVVNVLNTKASQDELNSLRSTVNSLQNSLSALTTRISNLESRVADLENSEGGGSGGGGTTGTPTAAIWLQPLALGYKYNTPDGNNGVWQNLSATSIILDNGIPAICCARKHTNGTIQGYILTHSGLSPISESEYNQIDKYLGYISINLLKAP